MKSSTVAATHQTLVKAITFGVPLILLFAVNTSFAAPANSNEDQIGFSAPSRQGFRSRENNPSPVEFNLVPVIPESGIPLETPMGLQQQQPSWDLAMLLNLLAKHSAMGGRARFVSDWDSGRSELARKRSSTTRSRYCAFNAVSCFGRKK